MLFLPLQLLEIRLKSLTAVDVERVRLPGSAAMLGRSHFTATEEQLSPNLQLSLRERIDALNCDIHDGALAPL